MALFVLVAMRFIGGMVPAHVTRVGLMVAIRLQMLICTGHFAARAPR